MIPYRPGVIAQNIICFLFLKDKLTCVISGSPLALRYFAIDPDACLVRVSTALTEDVGRSTEYNVNNSSLIS